MLLNACYSEVQAIAIHQIVDGVIGMNQPIGDKAAILFAEGFYDALGAGKPYEEAYKIGCNAIALEGIPEHQIPVLKNRKRRSGSLPVEPSASPLKGQPESGTGAIADTPARSTQLHLLATSRLAVATILSIISSREAMSRSAKRHRKAAVTLTYKRR